MRILGIDCGTNRTGYGVIDSDGARHKLVEAGVIRTGAKERLEKKLLEIGLALREVMARHRPDAAAVESVFYAVNAKTAIKLAHVRGAALLVVAETGVELGEYSPAEVKTSVVGYGRAEKEQVKLMVRSILGLDEVIASSDASDALAVAICHATHAAYWRAGA
jgi:crossover junction endodeoxyribonuclease RuvC